MTRNEAMVKYGLSKTPAAVLERLASTPGVIVEYGDLQTVCEEQTGNGWNMYSVQKALVKIRRVVKDATITTYSGVGYQLVWHNPDDRHAGKP